MDAGLLAGGGGGGGGGGARWLQPGICDELGGRRTGARRWEVPRVATLWGLMTLPA